MKLELSVVGKKQGGGLREKQMKCGQTEITRTNLNHQNTDLSRKHGCQQRRKLFSRRNKNTWH